MEEQAEKMPEVTGNPSKDMTAFNKSKSYAFGIQLLKHYVPRNGKLIAYFEGNEETPELFKHLKYNLKVITHAQKNK